MLEKDQNSKNCFWNILLTLSIYSDVALSHFPTVFGDNLNFMPDKVTNLKILQKSEILALFGMKLKKSAKTCQT